MISIDGLVKEFRVYRRRTGMLKGILGLARSGVDYDEICSLKGVSLEVPAGEVHGIIGMNGAGKSTLLKILTGVLAPTKGAVVVKGRIAALLELGTGFHHELTGRENIYLNGAIMGFTRAEMASKIDQIQDFAELGEFFDRPIRIYSSGMYVRLAFAFAVSVDPEVLIIDEALAVGDAYFQQKCMKKIRAFKDKGVTILFVSHDLGAIKMLCDKVTLLAKGEVLFSGLPMQALDLYNAMLAEQHQTSMAASLASAAGNIQPDTSYQSGNLAMEIESVKILNERDEEVHALISGDSCTIEVIAKTNRGPINSPTCGILIRDRLGYDVFGTNTHSLRLATGVHQAGDRTAFRFHLPLNIGAGDYTVTAALHSDKSHTDENYHWLDRAKIFKVLPSVDFEFIGVAKLFPVGHAIPLTPGRT